jgi:hypothetical protein
MDLAKADMSLPKTIVLIMPSFTLTPGYQLSKNAHVVATKMRVSCINGQIDDKALGSSFMMWEQCSVVPNLIPNEPIGIAMQPPTTESHDRQKKAVTYLFLPKRAETRTTKGIMVKGTANGYNMLI